MTGLEVFRRFIVQRAGDGQILAFADVTVDRISKELEPYAPAMSSALAFMPCASANIVACLRPRGDVVFVCSGCEEWTVSAFCWFYRGNIRFKTQPDIGWPGHAWIVRVADTHFALLFWHSLTTVGRNGQVDAIARQDFKAIIPECEHTRRCFGIVPSEQLPLLRRILADEWHWSITDL